MLEAPKRQKTDNGPAQRQEQASVSMWLILWPLGQCAKCCAATEDLDSKDTSVADDGRRVKTLNLNTYKWHALGDVVPAIRLFGTTDSYSTQIVSAPTPN